MAGKLYLTASAFFSFLFFRGVSYHTPFLNDAPNPTVTTQAHSRIFFTDFDDWINLKDSLGKEESYYCNTNAYGGACASDRNTEHASKFWKAALAWEKEFRGRSLPIPYKDYNAFIKRQDGLGNLFSIGNLMKMLLLGTMMLFLLTSSC